MNVGTQFFNIALESKNNLKYFKNNREKFGNKKLMFYICDIKKKQNEHILQNKRIKS